MSDQATDLQGAAATQRNGRRRETVTAPALPRRMKVEEGRFEPTVVGAVRRYWLMVGVIALLTTASAVGYTLVVPEVYRADATATVPQTLLSQEEASDQYLDSQVLLLQSQEVADRAARIANAALNENVLSPRDFSGEGKFLEIKAPEGASPGSYGASIVAVSFTWPSARVAQIGTNAVLQAFDDVRAAAIKAQGEAIVAGIEKAIDDARTEGQRKDLLKQRTQTLVNQQIDLARHPTVAWAAEPQVPINGNSQRSGAIGLVIGTVLGAGLAYARASRRRCLDDRLEPAAIYEAPLIGEIPARGSFRIISRTDAASGHPPEAHILWFGVRLRRRARCRLLRCAGGNVGRGRSLESRQQKPPPRHVLRACFAFLWHWRGAPGADEMDYCGRSTADG